MTSPSSGQGYASGSVPCAAARSRNSIMWRALTATSSASRVLSAGSGRSATWAEKRSTHARMPYAWRAKTGPRWSARSRTWASSPAFWGAIFGRFFPSVTRVACSSATILHLDPRGERVRDPAERPRALDQHGQRVVVEGRGALDDEPLVAQLAPGALRAHGHAQAGDLERALARDVPDRQAEAARERAAEELGRHEALVVAAVLGGLVDRDAVAARLHVGAEAAAEAR